MKFPDKVYDILKWICMIVLPALAVLIRTIFPVWDIPLAEPISITIMGVDAFLGALLGISTINYNKENMNGEDNS